MLEWLAPCFRVSYWNFLNFVPACTAWAHGIFVTRDLPLSINLFITKTRGPRALVINRLGDRFFFRMTIDSIFRCHIQHNRAHNPTVTVAKLQSNFAFTNDTPYLALTGELWGVFRELLVFLATTGRWCSPKKTGNEVKAFTCSIRHVWPLDVRQIHYLCPHPPLYGCHPVGHSQPDDPDVTLTSGHTRVNRQSDHPQGSFWFIGPHRCLPEKLFVTIGYNHKYCFYPTFT